MAIVNLKDSETGSALRHQVGARLREFRKSKGLTLEQLGLQCGTSGQTIQRLECGTMTLSVDWIQRICETLGVPPSALFGNEDGVLQKVAARKIHSEARNLRFYAQIVIERVDKFLDVSDE
jgi:transcriptional regulator with XRE-family HTH domain